VSTLRESFTKEMDELEKRMYKLLCIKALEGLHERIQFSTV